MKPRPSRLMSVPVPVPESLTALAKQTTAAICAAGLSSAAVHKRRGRIRSIVGFWLLSYRFCRDYRPVAHSALHATRVTRQYCSGAASIPVYWED